MKSLGGPVGTYSSQALPVQPEGRKAATIITPEA
jgi:hypothetical protein